MKLLPYAFALLLVVAVHLYEHHRAPEPTPAPVRPSAIINGPATAQVGKLVEFTSEGSAADTFEWNVPDENWRKWPDGSKVIGSFQSPGQAEIDLFAFASVNGAIRSATASKRIDVEAPPAPPNPGPAPGPNPPAPPTPPTPLPLPPGRFNLAAQSRDWAAAVTLSPADKLRTAQALAGSFEGMASKIAAGGVATIADAISQTKASNDAALGAAAAAWLPWAARWKAALAQLNGGGQVKSLPDVADAFRETAQGLRAIIQ